MRNGAFNHLRFLSLLLAAFGSSRGVLWISVVGYVKRGKGERKVAGENKAAGEIPTEVHLVASVGKYVL